MLFIVNKFFMTDSPHYHDDVLFCKLSDAALFTPNHADMVGLLCLSGMGVYCMCLEG